MKQDLFSDWVVINQSTENLTAMILRRFCFKKKTNNLFDVKNCLVSKNQ